MSETAAVGRVHNGLTIPTPGTYTLDPNHKRIGFVARHLMVAKVRGEFLDASATITVAEDPMQSSVTATIQAASVHTGVEQRDNHLRSADFFETEKWQTLEYRSTGIKSVDGNEFVLAGDLTIRGVTVPVDLTVELEGVGKSLHGGEVFGFSATGELNREDFGLTYNMALETGGVMVGKTVKIEIEGEAVKQG